MPDSTGQGVVLPITGLSLPVLCFLQQNGLTTENCCQKSLLERHNLPLVDSGLQLVPSSSLRCLGKFQFLESPYFSVSITKGQVAVVSL